jgi:hypothetical protein
MLIIFLLSEIEELHIGKTSAKGSEIKFIIGLSEGTF